MSLTRVSRESHSFPGAKSHQSQGGYLSPRLRLAPPTIVPGPLRGRAHTEMDLRWIRSDLAALRNRERLLEADLAQVIADDLALADAGRARAAASNGVPSEGGGMTSAHRGPAHGIGQ